MGDSSDASVATKHLKLALGRHPWNISRPRIVPYNYTNHIHSISLHRQAYGSCGGEVAVIVYILRVAWRMRRLSPPRGWTRRYASSIWLYSLWGTAALLFLHFPRGMQAFVPWYCPRGTTYIDGVTKRRRLMKRPGSTPDGIIASTLDSIPSIPRRSAHDCGNSRYHEASHLSIHASAAAAAVPGSLGGGGMHIPPSRSKPGSGGTFSSSTHAGAVITPTPAPPAILTEKDRVTRPQRQLVWGEEELRLRIREVEGAVETLRATALAQCRECFP